MNYGYLGTPLVKIWRVDIAAFFASRLHLIVHKVSKC